MGCSRRLHWPRRASVLLCLVWLLTWHAARAEQATLANAVEQGNQAIIKGLVKRGSNVNVAQPDGMTALHWAAQRQDIGTAKRLLDAGANANAQNHYGVTPLSCAAVGGNTSLVALLLAAGADPNATLRGGETVLMTAARTGKVGPVKALLAKGAQVNMVDRHGQTAVMWAAAEGNDAVVATLLKADAAWKQPLFDSGFTPLAFASRQGHAKVVRLLLKAGADVNEAMLPHKKFSRAPRTGTSPLLLAVENGHFDLAVELLNAGADPNDQRSGFTALHALTWVRKPNRGDEEDSDPEPTGSGTLTSLAFAAQLVKHGANVNAQLAQGNASKGQLTRKGATPFLLAAAKADLAYLRVLWALGANPLLPNADNCQPLSAAAGVGTLAPEEEAGTEPEVIETVQYLLSLGADVNVVDENGETAMHGAAYKSVPKVVQLLADNGAKASVWDRANKWGWTPIQIAQGHRVGNFRPSSPTEAALRRVLATPRMSP